MKKILIATLIVSTFSMVGCGSSKAEEAAEISEKAVLKARVEALEKENEELKLQVSNLENKEYTVGIINHIFDEGGKKYLMFDDALFLSGDEAKDAAKADGDPYYKDLEYYFLNEDETFKKYELASNSKFYELNFDTSELSPLAEVEYETFKANVNERRHDYFRIYMKDDVIVKVERQFTP